MRVESGGGARRAAPAAEGCPTGGNAAGLLDAREGGAGGLDSSDFSTNEPSANRLSPTVFRRVITMTSLFAFGGGGDELDTRGFSFSS